MSRNRLKQLIVDRATPRDARALHDKSLSLSDTFVAPASAVA
jgi:hypothetical protein